MKGRQKRNELNRGEAALSMGRIFGNYFPYTEATITSKYSRIKMPIRDFKEIFLPRVKLNRGHNPQYIYQYTQFSKLLGPYQATTFTVSINGEDSHFYQLTALEKNFQINREHFIHYLSASYPGEEVDPQVFATDNFRKLHYDIGNLPDLTIDNNGKIFPLNLRSTEPEPLTNHRLIPSFFIIRSEGRIVASIPESLAWRLRRAGMISWCFILNEKNSYEMINGLP